MPPILMTNNLNPNRFSTNFTDEQFIEYLCLIFEDDNYTMDDLRPFVFDTVIKAVDMYERHNRDSMLSVYVTQCVKVAVENYKNQNNL